MYSPSEMLWLQPNVLTHTGCVPGTQLSTPVAAAHCEMSASVNALGCNTAARARRPTSGSEALTGRTGAEESPWASQSSMSSKSTAAAAVTTAVDTVIAAFALYNRKGKGDPARSSKPQKARCFYSATTAAFTLSFDVSVNWHPPELTYQGSGADHVGAFQPQHAIQPQPGILVCCLTNNLSSRYAASRDATLL